MQDLERFDKGGYGKIWQDLIRETCQNLARFGKIRQDLTKGGMARFGKIWQDLARFDKGGHGKIWQDLTNRRCQDLARCGKI